MLVFILVASLYSHFDKRSIEVTGEYASFHDCRQGARNFYYDKMKDPPPYFPEDTPAELHAGIDFTWTCEGHVK